MRTSSEVVYLEACISEEQYKLDIARAGLTAAKTSHRVLVLAEARVLEELFTARMEIPAVTDALRKMIQAYGAEYEALEIMVDARQQELAALHEQLAHQERIDAEEQAQKEGRSS